MSSRREGTRQRTQDSSSRQTTERTYGFNPTRETSDTHIDDMARHFSTMGLGHSSRVSDYDLRISPSPSDLPPRYDDARPSSREQYLSAIPVGIQGGRGRYYNSPSPSSGEGELFAGLKVRAETLRNTRGDLRRRENDLQRKETELLEKQGLNRDRGDMADRYIDRFESIERDYNRHETDRFRLFEPSGDATRTPQDEERIQRNLDSLRECHGQFVNLIEEWRTHAPNNERATSSRLDASQYTDTLMTNLRTALEREQAAVYKHDQEYTKRGQVLSARRSQLQTEWTQYESSRSELQRRVSHMPPGMRDTMGDF